MRAFYKKQKILHLLRGAGLAILTMRSKHKERGKSHKNVNNAGNHRVRAAKKGADIPSEQANEKPVEASDDKKDKGDHV